MPFTQVSYAISLGGTGDNWSIYRMPAGGSTWTSLFTILGTGKVGLGTTAPTALLHLVTTDTTTFSATANPTTRMLLGNLDTTTNNFIDIVFAANDSAASMIGAAKLSGIFTSHTAGAVAGDLVVTTRNAGTWGEVARFASTGYLGVGTPSPTSRLQVVGLATYASNAAAITAGLTAGAFYTDGAAAVKVVY